MKNKTILAVIAISTGIFSVVISAVPLENVEIDVTNKWDRTINLLIGCEMGPYGVLCHQINFSPDHLKIGAKGIGTLSSRKDAEETLFLLVHWNPKPPWPLQPEKCTLKFRSSGNGVMYDVTTSCTSNLIQLLPQGPKNSFVIMKKGK